MGGLAHDETSFMKKNKNTCSSNDLLDRSYLSDGDWKMERKRKIGNNLNKLNSKDETLEFSQTSNQGLRTLKMIKQQTSNLDASQLSSQPYQEINEKLNFLTN